MSGLSKVACYRFGEFTLSPRRRLLLRHGMSVPLIPKYFDLLCLLVERRSEALDRQVIFDRIWPDVVVFGSVLGRSPGALGGPFEGGIVGCAAGIGYAVSSYTPRGGGMATPRGTDRLRVGIGTALCCALFTAALGGLGGRTVSVTLDTLSLTYDGSQVGLAPLAPFLGEHDPRPVTQAAASGFEGLLFAGTRFALVRAGLAQLVFLVLFSYAFFFEGFTGLTVTVGAIVTLFIMMQLTARVDWSKTLTLEMPNLLRRT